MEQPAIRFQPLVSPGPHIISRPCGYLGSVAVTALLLWGCAGRATPTAEPTPTCVSVPVTGHLHGDPAQPDRIEIIGGDVSVRILITYPSAPYEYEFDPTLRVVERASGTTIAREGDTVEAGGELMPNGTYRACGLWRPN